MSDVSTQEEADQRNQELWATVPADLERLAEQCSDEYHGEIGTFQDFADDRSRWREFAKFLWGLGARPQREGCGRAREDRMETKIPEKFLEAARRGVEAHERTRLARQQQQLEIARLDAEESERWVQEQLPELIEDALRQGQRKIVLDRDVLALIASRGFPRTNPVDIALSARRLGIGTGRASALNGQPSAYWITIPLAQFTGACAIEFGECCSLQGEP